MQMAFLCILKYAFAVSYDIKVQDKSWPKIQHCIRVVGYKTWE